ncbi:MAG: hypothetical protein FRC54_10800 [bacterium LCO1.1]|uniref:Uncharacterized protein n=1 Tax=Candidatus Weimeria bifida TaxID=2599074 RepID=A0A6N7J317_9FIRM|nr:hypothetical protein [Candidatus Weimeria bifida]
MYCITAYCSNGNNSDCWDICSDLCRRDITDRTCTRVSDQNVELKDSVIRHKKVLKSPAKYIKNTMAVKKRKFTYALIDMDKSGIPCLVMKQADLMKLDIVL